MLRNTVKLASCGAEAAYHTRVKASRQMGEVWSAGVFYWAGVAGATTPIQVKTRFSLAAPAGVQIGWP